MTEEEIARWIAWDRFIEAHPDTGFMQSSPWAQFRARSGGEHFAVTLKDGGQIVGGAVVGKWTYEPGQCFYYVQEGPVLPADESMAAEVFEAVLASIERHRAAEGATVSHLRIEPRWQRLPGFVRGFRTVDSPDGFREPRRTLCIDLRPGEDEILAQMKPKGRYNIRVARKHGVTVVKDNSYQGSVDFIRIQRATARRKGIEARSTEYFRALLSEMLTRKRASLYFAEYRGRRLATALVVTCGARATYFFGGSLARDRHVMAPYLLHFEILRQAKARGCAWYDFWGVAPAGQTDDAWQAISDFKRKFGGTEVALVPTLDHVYDEAAYERFQAAQTGAAGLPKPAIVSSRSTHRGANELQAIERAAPASPHDEKEAPLARVREFDAAVEPRQFARLRRTFPEDHFLHLLREEFPFYRTTFWYPLDREPENAFEAIVRSLRPLAAPSAGVTGAEWWFSVAMTNTTPQWLLPCHFDRNDLSEREPRRIRHPEVASVLFLTSVPYGELVVTDQRFDGFDAPSGQPKAMRFIRPRANRYATFPGELYHGVIGRMWRPSRPTRLRIAMAVNWWIEKPEAAYLADSRTCLQAFRLRT